MSRSAASPTVQSLDLGLSADAPTDWDNLTDWALTQFRERYGGHIAKDDVWEYLYGVMHAPDWRERYRHDLQRNLPRVPLADDFEAFRSAGRALIDLHVGYETVEEHPEAVCEVDGRPDDGTSDPGAYRIESKMRWGGGRSQANEDRSVLIVNDRCRLVGIPPEAHNYTVSGRSPLHWAVESLRFKRDKASGIADDPNGWHDWADEPFNLIRHLRRLVTVSVETRPDRRRSAAGAASEQRSGLTVDGTLGAAPGLRRIDGRPTAPSPLPARLLRAAALSDDVSVPETMPARRGETPVIEVAVTAAGLRTAMFHVRPGSHPKVEVEAIIQTSELGAATNAVFERLGAALEACLLYVRGHAQRQREAASGGDRSGWHSAQPTEPHAPSSDGSPSCDDPATEPVLTLLRCDVDEIKELIAEIREMSWRDGFTVVDIRLNDIERLLVR